MSLRDQILEAIKAEMGLRPTGPVVQNPIDPLDYQKLMAIMIKGYDPKTLKFEVTRSDLIDALEKLHDKKDLSFEYEEKVFKIMADKTPLFVTSTDGRLEVRTLLQSVKIDLFDVTATKVDDYKEKLPEGVKPSIVRAKVKKWSHYVTDGFVLTFQTYVEMKKVEGQPRREAVKIAYFLPPRDLNQEKLMNFYKWLSDFAKGGVQRGPSDVGAAAGASGVERPTNFGKPDIIPHLFQKMVSLPSLTEVEISFGMFDNASRFVPGLLSAHEFSEIIDSFDSFGFEKKERKYTVTVYEGNIRSIQDNGSKSVTFERKERIPVKIENEMWGYRISASIETEIAAPKKLPQIIKTRKISRSSYTDKGMRFDLSLVRDSSHPKPIFEFEIEAVDLKVPNLVEKYNSALKMGLKLIGGGELYSLGERFLAVDFHNSMFKGQKGGLHEIHGGYWNKPVDLVGQNLLEKDGNWSITVKADGLRRSLLFTDSGTWIFSPPGYARKVGPFDQKMVGTLLDCEIITDEMSGDSTLKVFDCLFYKGKDVRGEPFEKRIGYAPKAGEKADDKSLRIEGFGVKLYESYSYEVKSFYFGPRSTLYQRVDQALMEMDATGKALTDGLIFQSLGLYKNKDTFKWKPAEKLTIDFLLKKTPAENIYGMYLGNGKGKDIQFMGTTNAKFRGKIKLPADTEDLDGLIVEVGFVRGDKGKLDLPYVFKIRNDRERPNELTVGGSVWNRIQNPVPREGIAGKSLYLLRKYHNIEKEEMIKQYIKNGDTIVDWGSGRGGDINKWERAKVRIVYAVEPNAENREEIKVRIDQLVSTLTTRINIIPMGAQDFTPDHPVDVLSAFFSLTFFPKEETLFDAMINSASRTVKSRGYFIGIVMDGSFTDNLLGKGEKYDGESFSIVRKKNPEGVWGREIEIDLKDGSSMVRSQKEWLFDFKVFQENLERAGFTLVEQRRLDGSVRNDVSYMVGLLPAESAIFSSLFRAFVFQKN